MPTYRLYLQNDEKSTLIRRFKHQELQALDYDNLECLLDDVRNAYWKLIGRTDLTPPTDWQIFRIQTRPAIRTFQHSVTKTIGTLIGFLIQMFAIACGGIVVAGVALGLIGGGIAITKWVQAYRTPTAIVSYEETPFCAVEQ